MNETKVEFTTPKNAIRHMEPTVNRERLCLVPSPSETAQLGNHGQVEGGSRKRTSNVRRKPPLT
jgi:hypothetical protein